MKKLGLILAVIMGMAAMVAIAQEVAPKQQENEPKAAKTEGALEEKNGVRAGDLLASCKNQFVNTFNTRESISKRASCNGYFFGVGGVLVLLQHEGVSTGACIPSDASTNDIIKAFLDWANNGDNDLSMPAAEATLQAIKFQFKCGE